MTKTSRILVRQVMGDRIEIIDGMMTVHDGIKLAKEKKLRAVLIEKRDEFDDYGIVTLADIAKKIVAVDRAPMRVNMYEIMTKPVLKVEASMNVRNCARLFDNFGIHAAPVFDHGKLVGIVSYNDIILKGMLAEELES